MKPVWECYLRKGATLFSPVDASGLRAAVSHPSINAAKRASRELTKTPNGAHAKEQVLIWTKPRAAARAAQ